MDMVFVYEDKIAQDAYGKYYTGSAFSQEIFNRYLEHFDSITVLMRRADVDPGDLETLHRMNKIDTSRIEIVFLPDRTESLGKYLDPRVYHEFKQTVLDSITSKQAVIIRAPSSSGTIAADFCHKHGIPYLAEAVGCPWDSLWNHSLKGKVLAPKAWLQFRRTMRNADYAVYVTERFLQRRYPTSGKMAAISDVELSTLDDEILARRLDKIKKRKGRIKIGTAGALNVSYKGQRYVIEALAKLKEHGNTAFEYHLAGGGDQSTLRNLADQLGVSNQVFFEGSLPHNAVFSWMDEMDLYVQPSTVDSMPRALIEALSRGLPAYGSRVGGIPELLGDSCLFKKRDVGAIVDKLSEIQTPMLLKMAEDSFKKAKAYEKESLEKKRYAFYREFARIQGENL